MISNSRCGLGILSIGFVSIVAIGLRAAPAVAAELVHVGQIVIEAETLIWESPDLVRMTGNVRVGNPAFLYLAGLGQNSEVRVDTSQEEVTVVSCEAETYLYAVDVSYPLSTTATQIEILPNEGAVRWEGTMRMPPIAPLALRGLELVGDFEINVNDQILTGNATVRDPLWGDDLVSVGLQLDAQLPWANSYIDIVSDINRRIDIAAGIALSAEADAQLRIIPVEGIYTFGFSAPSLELELPQVEGVNLKFDPIGHVLMSVNFADHCVELGGGLSISAAALGHPEVPLGVGIDGTRVLTWEPWTFTDEVGITLEAFEVLQVQVLNGRNFFDFTNCRFEFDIDVVDVHIGNLFGINVASGHVRLNLLDDNGQFAPNLAGRGNFGTFSGALHPLGGTGAETSFSFNLQTEQFTGTMHSGFGMFGFPILATDSGYHIENTEVLLHTCLEILWIPICADLRIGTMVMMGSFDGGFWVGPFWVPPSTDFLVNEDGMFITVELTELFTIGLWIKPNGTWQIIWDTPEPQAIHDGINWLRDRQLGNGSWSNDPAHTSFVILSMVNAGYTEEHSTVSLGIQYVLSRMNGDGSVHNQSHRYTYYTSIAVLPLVATHNEDYHDEITLMRNWLINSQWDEDSFYGSVNPGHWYYGGFGYGNGTRPDLSNTQWALMGLHAADWEIGLAASDTYDKTLTYLDRCRNGDGGSGYTPGDGSIHTMTAASVWSYSLCGIGAGEPRVADGIQWLADHYSLINNDGWGYWSEYYYNVTLAKALVMTHKTQLAGYNWFSELVSKLIDEQDGDGNWPDTGMGGEELSTCWAVLSLQTRTLPPGANVTMSIILASHADVHVYDPQGRHVGVDYDTMTLELGIPGASFKLLDENGYEIPFTYPIPEDAKQAIELPYLTAGSYFIELVGTSDGPFELTVSGSQDGEEVTSNTYQGDITESERLAGHITVTAMEGALTFLYEDLTGLPMLVVTPSEYMFLVDPNSIAELPFAVQEMGEDYDLLSVSIHCTDLEGDEDTISGAGVLFDTNNFDVPAGGEQPVLASIPIPTDFIGPASGLIVVESLNGGTRSMRLTVSTVRNVSSECNVEYSGLRYDRPTGESQTTVTITNTSAQGIHKRLYLAVEDVTPGTVIPANVDGSILGKPYFDFTELLTDGGLSPGEAVSKQIAFDNPDRLRFRAEVSVYGVPESVLVGSQPVFAIGDLALGDMNCDGVVNGLDIDPFVLALTDADGYAAAYPNCGRNLADFNGDGQVNGLDIDGFVGALGGE